MLIKNAKIILENQEIIGNIEVKNGIISKIIETNNTWYDVIIIPGFIDTHIHGGYGYDFMDGDANGGFGEFAKNLLKEGVTSLIQSTVTDSIQNTNIATKKFGEYILKNKDYKDRAEHLGIHIEGKWINKEQKGAHDASEIVPANIEWFKQLNSNANGLIKQVTLAVEIKENLELAKYLAKNNIIVAAGHTNIKMKQALELFNQKIIKNITHLYNQMSRYTHRSPGLVPAVLQDNKIPCELICDGIHVDREIVKLTYKLIGAKRIILITDAMRAKGLGSGEYLLGNLGVIVHNDGSARLMDGQLAGSTLTMIQAFKNIIQFTDCNLIEAVKMSSTNAAKLYGVYHDRGSISVGKKADLIILNKNLSILDILKS